MEFKNKKKYNFALSSFSRMYGIGACSNSYYKQFCLEWSEWGVDAPLSGLEEVDQYFYHEYKNWRSR